MKVNTVFPKVVLIVVIRKYFIVLQISFLRTQQCSYPFNRFFRAEHT